MRCKNASSENRAKEVTIDGFSANIQRVVKMPWGCKQNALLLEIAKFAVVLLKQTYQEPSLVVTQNCKSSADKGRRARQVVATVEKVPEQVPKSNNHYNQKQRVRPYR